MEMDRKQKTCVIVGAGSFDGMSILPKQDDLIIAADGGYSYLKQMEIEADVLLGDFDSLEIVPEHRHLIRHSPIKDDTDMALAAAYAREQGCSRFLIYGGLGGRLDHTIANLQLLTGLSRNGAEVYLIGEGVIITAISGIKRHRQNDAPVCTREVFPTDFEALSCRNACSVSERCVSGEEICFGAEARGMISVFCQGGPASGVWEKGLKYTLSDAVLTDDRALGVSNEFLGCESSISVESGTLLVMWDIKNGLPVRRQ